MSLTLTARAVIGAPTVLALDDSGAEITAVRLTGSFAAGDLLTRLKDLPK